jgi:DNA polymerase-3 subunit gamma/tau
VQAQPVREMLGLADRTRVLDLFEASMRGDVAAALAEFRDQYEAGADPVAVLQDLLEVTHWVTRIKLAPEAAGDSATPEEERTRGQANAQGLSIPALSRTWQMLLKGLSETRDAPQPVTAAEMALIRLAYAADLPDPADLVRTIRDGGAAPEPAARTAPPAGGSGAARGAAALSAAQARPVPVAEERPETTPTPRAEVRPIAVPDFAALVALAGERRDRLKTYLETYVHLVRFEDGRIEFRPAAGAPKNLPNELSERLAAWTGRRWIVTVSNAPGAPTLAQQAKDDGEALLERMRRDPAVAAVLAAFPGAEVVNVRELAGIDASEGDRPPNALADEPSDADVGDEDENDLNEDES